MVFRERERRAHSCFCAAGQKTGDADVEAFRKVKEAYECLRVSRVNPTQTFYRGFVFRKRLPSRECVLFLGEVLLSSDAHSLHRGVSFLSSFPR